MTWIASRTLLVILATLCLFNPGCRRKSDEEVLRKRLDTNAVYFYLATKIAVLKADSSPEVQAARKQLLAVITAASKPAAPRADVQGGEGAAAPGKVASAPGPDTHSGYQLSAKDVVGLAKALWSLRSQGKAAFETGREEQLNPMLPVLFQGQPELARIFDRNMEHATLLAALFILKIHPKMPIPLPVELSLYEAWMTDAGALKLPGTESLARSIKAFLYGTNQLCDLAAVEAKGLEGKGLNAHQLRDTLKQVTGAEMSELDDRDAARSEAALRAMAHGVSAGCFMMRKEKDKAVAELDPMIKALADAGVPAGETAAVRGFIAFEKGDRAAALKCLEEARSYQGTDPETRKDLTTLIEALKTQDNGRIDKYFGESYFAIFGAKLLWRELDRAGILDTVKDTEMAKTVQRYLDVAGQMMVDANGAIPTTDEAKSRAKSLWKKLSD